MPAEFKLTDAIDASIISNLQQISSQLKSMTSQLDDASDAYANLASNMADGLKIKPADLSALESKYNTMAQNMAKLEETQKQLAATQQQYQSLLKRYNDAVAEAAKKAEELNKQRKEEKNIVGQTTPVISRELAEKEKLNKASREEYTINKEALDMARQVLGSREANTRALVEYKQQLEYIKSARADVNKAEEDGIITSEEALNKRTRLLEEERSIKVAISDTQRVLKIEEKMAQEASGSYAELSQQLSLMKSAYKQLNEEQKASDVGQTLYNEINSLDAHLKDLAADMGEFQRNVGNYAIAGENVRSELRNLTQEIASLTIAYRRLSDEERNSEQGKQMAAKLQELTTKASEYRDAMADANREISSGASDTKNWDAIAGQLGIVTAGFAAATMGAKALGLAEEETKEVQASAVAVLALASQARQVQNNLQKESALMLGISTIQTKALTAAENINTAAKGKNIIVTKAATLAQAAFNAVAKANPYVLLATALITVVGALTAFAIGSRKAEKDTERMNKELEKSKDALQDIEDKADFDIRIAEAAGASTKELRKMRFEAAMAANEMANIAKNDAFKKLQAGEIDKATYDEYVKQEEETYKKLQKIQQDNQVERTKEETQARRDAEAARTKAAQDAAAARLKQREEEAAYLEDIEKQLAQSVIAIMEDEREREKATINAKYNERLAAIKGESEKENELRTNLEIQRYDELAKVEEEYARQQREHEEQLQQERMDAIDDEMANIAKASQMALNLRMSMLAQEYAQQKITEEEYNQKKNDLAKEYAKREVDTTIAYLEEELKAQDLTNEQRESLEEQLAQKRIELSQQVADIEIANNKRIADSHRETLNGVSEIIQYASEAIGAFSNLGDTLMQNKLDKIQEQMDDIEKRYEEETSIIEELEKNGSLSTEEAEARKRAARDRSEAQTEKLAKKQEEMEKKQARLAKATALAQATMSTALAIMRVYADPGNGGFISRSAMAAIVSALGAVQLATIAATPLSAYAHGTDNHPGGKAIVGDGGRNEVVLIGNKAYLTPDTPTLVDLPAHARVFPDIDQWNIFQNGKSISIAGEIPTINVAGDYSSLERTNREITNEQTEKLLRQMRANQRTSYMNSYIQSKL